MRKSHVKYIGISVFCVSVVLLSVLLNTAYPRVSKKSRILSFVDQPTNFERKGRNKEMTYYHRINRSRNYCLRKHISINGVNTILSLKRYAVSYCVAPKVGCTYWTNIFRFLSNATDGFTYQSPLDIPRSITHYGSKTNLEIEYSVSEAMGNHFRFMFAREPYARLWSAYLDKFYLPDFWNSEAETIDRFIKGKNNLTCHNNVSFADFLNYVVSSPPFDQNEHWSPISQMCDPCVFRPHIIGKMETFLDDSLYILEKIGLPWIENDTKSRDHAKEEIEMLSAYNFLLQNDTTDCLSAIQISKRLWRTFQINGYIQESSQFPIRPNSFWNLNSFRLEILKRYTHDRISSSERKGIRERGLLAAYSKISRTVILKIRHRYHEDFRMFGYDPNLIPLPNPDFN